MAFLPTLRGLFLPLVTPFRDGELDEASLRRLVRHYAARPLEGLILAGTTGEAATLDEDETERLVMIAAEALAEAGSPLPLWLGRSGSDTRRGARAVERTASWPVAGYLVTCPAFTRPSQQGLVAHYTALAGSTARPVLAYNIPYRTGVTMSVETLLRLAEVPGMAGVKDCGADPAQSFDLLRGRPAGFAVLSGEDGQYLPALAQGADGGILASAHVATESFAALPGMLAEGRLGEALEAWRRLADLPRLLFAEPNPAPIKHWLWRAGLLDSPEVRLPMTGVSAALADRLDAAMGRW